MAFELRRYKRLPSPTGGEGFGDPGESPSGAAQAEDARSQSEDASQTTACWVQTFDPQRQTLVLLLQQTLRWLGTVTFIALIIAILKIYELKGNFPLDQKATFHTILTASSLGLGLNFFVSRNPTKAEAHNTFKTSRLIGLQEAFKESAKLLRWRILAGREHSEREVGLILGIENLQNVIALGRESISKPRILLACITWVLLNLVAQTSVAAINLTCTVDDGKNYNDTYTRQGNVNVSDLTCYYNQYHQKECPGDVTRQAVAHAYGELSQTSTMCGPYTNITEIEVSEYDPPYYCRRTPGQQEFAYRFKEHNSDDLQGIFPSFTNRIVTVSSGKCFEYSQRNRIDDPDREAASKYTYGNETFNDTISLPNSSVGNSGTTYIYRDIERPQSVETYRCGPRCVMMWAYKAQGPKEPPTFYECPITVSSVSNTAQDSHDIPDSMARIAAASIALQGRWTGTIEDRRWTQYQFYAHGLAWETHGGDADHVGANMAEFALGSLATMANLNPSIQIWGGVPHLGSHLTVYGHWRPAIALLASIVGLHFALIITVVWMMTPVVVPDGSNVTIAKLLRGLTERNGDRAMLMRGVEFCGGTKRERRRGGGGGEVEGTASNGDAGFVYGPRKVGEGEFVLDIGKNVKPLREWNHGQHPNGKYMVESR